MGINVYIYRHSRWWLTNMLFHTAIMIAGGQLWWYFTFLAACHCLNLCVYLIVCRCTDMANKLSLSLFLQPSKIPIRLHVCSPIIMTTNVHLCFVRIPATSKEPSVQLRVVDKTRHYDADERRDATCERHSTVVTWHYCSVSAPLKKLTVHTTSLSALPSGNRQAIAVDFCRRWLDSQTPPAATSTWRCPGISRYRWEWDTEVFCRRTSTLPAVYTVVLSWCSYYTSLQNSEICIYCFASSGWSASV